MIKILITSLLLFVPQIIQFNYVKGSDQISPAIKEQIIKKCNELCVSQGFPGVRMVFVLAKTKEQKIAVKYICVDKDKSI